MAHESYREEQGRARKFARAQRNALKEYWRKNGYERGHGKYNGVHMERAEDNKLRPVCNEWEKPHEIEQLPSIKRAETREREDKKLAVGRAAVTNRMFEGFYSEQLRDEHERENNLRQQSLRVLQYLRRIDKPAALFMEAIWLGGTKFVR